MARRRGPYTSRRQCEEAGCREVAHFEYDTLRDRAESHKTARPWRCVRHTNAEQVLSVSNPRREMLLTVGLFDGCGDAHFFTEVRNGFIHGPGFKAFAGDLPIGARVRVCVEVLSGEQQPGDFEGRGVAREQQPDGHEP